MTSQIDIANRALLAIGARTQVSSINPSDGSTEANAISVLWTPTFEQLGRAAHWNCLRNQITLSLLAAASGTPENENGTSYPIPPTPWLYAYAYPADCLNMRYIVPSLPSGQGGATPQTSINNGAGTWLPTDGQIPFVVSYSSTENGAPLIIILTNQDQAQAVYTVNQPNPQSWDSMFQGAMVASLAAFLVPALSLSLPLMQAQIGLAERMIVGARVADGNEGVTAMDHVPDWIRARSGAQGYGWGYGNQINTWSGYCSVVWPAY